MTIAYIVPSLAPLGPVIVVRNLVERMVAHGHQCMVFYFDEKEQVMEFACPTKRISFWKKEDFSEYDWVHVHSFRPMVYAARIRHARKMTTMHSYIFTEYLYSLGRKKGSFLGHFTIWLAKRFQRVVVLSEDAKKYYGQWIPNENLRVCYNGVRIAQSNNERLSLQYTQDVEQIERFKGGNILVGCISELVPIKNVESMIKALALLPKKYSLLLIGSGDSEMQLKGLSTELGMANRVLFLGERTEAHRYLPKVDIFAMTSVSEGFCMALVEAAMYGKRIVCADIPGMREKFTDEEVTFYEMGNAKQLAAAIVDATANNKGPKALQRSELFSTERMYENYMKIYEE
jgi:glycosyltransferase involved in cell wall biosynthesis